MSQADDSLSLAEVLRHCAGLVDEIASGQLSDEGMKSRFSYLMTTLVQVQHEVEGFWLRMEAKHE